MHSISRDEAIRKAREGLTIRIIVRLVLAQPLIHLIYLRWQGHLVIKLIPPLRGFLELRGVVVRTVHIGPSSDRVAGGEIGRVVEEDVAIVGVGARVIEVPEVGVRPRGRGRRGSGKVG
jgi:hypothetical protein